MVHVFRKCLMLSAAILVPSAGSTQTAADITKREVGGLMLQNVPETTPEVRTKLERYENARSATFQDWMADGSMLITTRFGQTAQIHHVKVPGGARTQVTFFKEPIGGNEWPSSVQVQPLSNDKFIFARDVGGGEYYQGYYAGLTTPAQVFTEPNTRNAANEDGRIFYIFSRDGRTVAWSRIKPGSGDYDIMTMVPGAPGTRKVALKGAGALEPVSFSPDGRTLLVSRVISNAATRLFLLSLADGSTRELNPGAAPALYYGGQFTRDGKSILMLSDANAEVRRLVRYDIATGRTTTVTAPDLKWEVEAFDLSPTEDRLAMSLNEDGISRIVMTDLAGRRTKVQPKLPTGVLRALKFSPDGQRLAIGLTSTRTPGDVWSWDIGTGRLDQWTNSETGGIDISRIADPELVHFPSFDGRMIPAFVHKPLARTSPSPVIIWIHGGPESQERPTFNPNIAFWTAELGATVITPNVRGSTGYGKTWLSLDNGTKRGDAIKDIGALLDWIKTRPELDSRRVIVMGASYGGFMTLASLSNYGDRLAGGIDIVGPSNYVTFLENTEGYRRDHRRAEYGDERDPATRAYLESIAPANNLAKMNKPLLVVQGANDPRVPRSEAETIVKNVRSRGADVWYILATDEGHGFGKKENIDTTNEAILMFLTKIFGPAPAGGGAEVRFRQIAKWATVCGIAFCSGGVAAGPPTVDGIWRSRGYGMIGEVANGTVTLYNVTKESCQKLPPVPGITDALFDRKSATVDGRRLLTKAPWGLTKLYFDRIDQLPAACRTTPPKATDPLYNFDVFWNTFDEQYAFFAQRGVDWHALRDEYRTRINANTTDAELIEIIRAMFRQLQDRHVSLSVGKLRVNAGFTELLNRWYAEYAERPVGTRSEFLRRQVVEYLTPSWSRNLDRNSVRPISSNVAIGTALNGTVGYLMVAAESGYAETDDLEPDKAAAIAQLDQAFGSLADKKAIILDLRINYGGHDDVALALAGLLAARERPGFSKCARDGTGYTPTQTTKIRPRPNAFTRPVIVLISAMNWSSGENLAMMIKDFPNVVLVGDRTAGVHSDTLVKFLPNGWRMTLSNEVFGAPDGTMYETIGVPPDILVPIELDEIRRSGIDPAMEKALHILSRQPSPADLARLKVGGSRGRYFPCPTPKR
ncbi:dipeptidyl aminopeptidase/acylaminoacyl peptidase [Sphingomonas sp. UYAg733]